MRLIALPFACLTLLASVAMADPVALDGQGDTSTTISVLRGALSVTVEASARSEVGTHRSHEASEDVPKSATPVAVREGERVDAPGADGQEQPGVSPREVDHCLAPAGTPGVRALKLPATIDPRKVRVLAVCEQAAPSAPARRLVEENDVLMSALGDAGFDAGSVAGIEANASGQVLLYAIGR